MFIVEYQTERDPLVGVPRFEETGGSWVETAPATFATEAEAADYLDALTHHYAAALRMDQAMILRNFRVVRAAESKAANVHLISAGTSEPPL